MYYCELVCRGFQLKWNVQPGMLNDYLDKFSRDYKYRIYSNDTEALLVVKI